jgi:hypothetical protein
MSADHNLEEQIDDYLNQRRPRFGHEKQSTARRLNGDDDKPQLREQTKTARGAATIEIEARLDLRFKNVHAVVKAAAGHSAQFEIDAIDIGENGQADTQARHQ